MNTKLNLIEICLLGAALLTALTSQAQPTVTKIAAGGYHTLFLKSDGSLWGMGDNEFGQLGDGTTNSIDQPEMIVASNVTAIAAGGLHTLFLKSDGSLWVMGNNEIGQLGDGLTNNILSPAPIVLSGVTAISAGFYHSLFVKSDGSLWAMGDNEYGQLGDGTYVSSVFQEEIVTNGVTAISAGGLHSLFLKKHGSVGHVTTELWAMGFNKAGELGDGTYDNTDKPELILSYTAPAVGSPVAAIAAGEYYSLLLKGDGSLWGMGDNEFGQLGDGTTNSTDDPEMIVASNVTAIAAGYFHSLFVKPDGSLWAMGSDEAGELGEGNIAPAPTSATTRPQQIVPSGVTAISAGSSDSLFIRQGGLWGMGYDANGQLGDDATNAAVDLPELILGPAPALGITTYGSQPVVFYPTAAGINYVLQMTTNLASSNWVTVTYFVPCTAALITNAPSNAFFRLH